MTAVFESSHPFAFFDYFRVPYLIRPLAPPGGQDGWPGWVRRLQVAEPAGGPRRMLLWPGATPDPPPRSRLGRYELADCTFFAHVEVDAGAGAWLGPAGRGWQPAEPVLDTDGRRVASTWRDEIGSLYLPFDPGEVMQRFWSERYREVGHSPLTAAGHAALVRAYYLARPAVPRSVQLLLRRGYSRAQARTAFPRWPVEDGLRNLYGWLFASIAGLAGRPVPFLGLWPRGRSWALVLTHDVETSAGYADMEWLRALERDRGYRSSWNFAGQRYQVDIRVVRALQQEGCEVGVHGLRHDGRDLGSRRLLARRLPAMRELAERWEAVGFRSPATQRRWEWMPGLGFEYDSSYTDSDPYEPQPGGCCTCLPYFNEGLVELPITLPQDHTLFRVLRDCDEDLWLRKARLLRERHEMVLALTHPDYARDGRVCGGYRSLLDTFQRDETAWHALPREVAAWWRERAESSVSRAGGGWAVRGPAAGRGQVQIASGPDF